MSSLNKVQLIGNLGRDPEVRYTPSGDAVTNLNIATSERWKDKTTGELKEETEWHRVSMFGKLAEIASQYLQKGSKVYIEGSLRTRKYTDKDGSEKYSTGIRAEVMKMLDARQDGGQRQPRQTEQQRPAQQRPAQQQAEQPRRQAADLADMDDDIPFN